MLCISVTVRTKKDANGEKHLCPKIKAIIDELQEAGITIVDGTH